MAISKLTVQALELLPKNLVSRAFGVISEVEFPGAVQGVVNRGFARVAKIDVDEAEAPPEAYRSLNAFFTRRLKEGARQVGEVPRGKMISPVDGRVGAFGRIEEGTLLQAKGREYRIVDLVDSAEEAARFQGGSYLTIYLSPRDYHRIHAPAAGRLDKISYIPGHLFPVNRFAVENIEELFAVNERLITYLETEELGRVAVVKVGATCVGRIGLSFDPFQTNRALRRREEFSPHEETSFQAGDELAVFNLGSTVILLVESKELDFGPLIRSGEVVKMGEGISR